MILSETGLQFFGSGYAANISISRTCAGPSILRGLRGTQGVRAIADSERNGAVVGAKLVNDEDEIMLITTGGVLIRTRVAEIRGMGRATQGVTLISLDDGEKLAGLEKIVESVGEIEAEGAGEAVGEASSEAAGDE